MRTAVTIIGGGPAGLAMSRCLHDRAIDHVVLERGEVANSWKTERWDSLRLLTPNWMTRLPGFRYVGGDPDGFMTSAQLVDVLDGYARSFDAPLRTHAAVTALRPGPDGYVVDTVTGSVDSRAVVIASGASRTPRLPAVAASLPEHLAQLPTLRYRRPDQLGTGGVLVVGASASGVQIADELRRRGREVTMAVGEHVRLPRTYRGRDIHRWMDGLGLLDERHTEVDDLARARRVPSAQLVGTPERRSIGLGELQQAGVRLVGRLVGSEGGRAQFSGSLANVVRSADLEQNRLLDRIDASIDRAGLDGELPAPDRPAPTEVAVAVNAIAWRDFETVVWATGYRAHYPWLDPALLDRHGQIPHDGGVMRQPGMYVLGLPFLRRRSSSFIYGLERDAVELADHVAGRLASPARAA